MSTTIQGLKILSLFIIATIIFQGCAKEEAIIEPVQEPSEELVNEIPFELYLTDCPFEADEVNVEILNVLLEDKDGEVESLITNSGVYNLLDFTNGIDTLLAFGNIEIDNIESIYIELGNQNTIVVDGVTFPLQLEGNNTIEIGVNLESIDHLAFLVDFFACTSITLDQGEYFLNPIIKFKGEQENSAELIEDLIEDFEECYQLVFPVLFLDKNGETLTATSRQSLIDILINNELSDVLFPINLLDPNGDAVQINAIEDVELLADCDLFTEEEDEEVIGQFEELLNQLEECYDIVFPLTLIDQNNNALEATNPDELLQIFENNQIEDVEFPVQLIDSNGETININQAVDFLLLDLDC